MAFDTRALVDRALAAATDTQSLILEAGALASVARVYSSIFGGRNGNRMPVATVVADSNTWSVAGAKVRDILLHGGIAIYEPIVLLEEPLHATYDQVLQIQAELAERPHSIPVAVGSGTINDLTKLAAHRIGRPYMVVPTAASMDGYAAFGASITRDGFKQTMACSAPAAIVADLDVLAAAPTRLTATGYGDLLGKVTAGADWLVADALAVEPIDGAAWAMVQEPLGAALGAPERLAAHDPHATEQFFLGLIISGLAMQATQSSRPASGAEHLLSHLWEMTGLAEGADPPSHGAKVGVGTVLVTLLYDRLLAHDLAAIDIDACVAALPTPGAVERAVRAGLPAGEVADRAVVESLAKHPTADELRARLGLLRQRWPDLRARLIGQLLPAAELRRRLRTLGARVLPHEIGVGPDRLRADLLAARTIRRRYTVLDLAAETGLLERCGDEVVAALTADRAQDTGGMGTA